MTAKENEKAKPARNAGVTTSDDDEELPPQRAAELARRESELHRLLAGGSLIETFRKKRR